MPSKKRNAKKVRKSLKLYELQRKCPGCGEWEKIVVLAESYDAAKEKMLAVERRETHSIRKTGEFK